MLGTKVEEFEIGRRLGEGGMGEVYLARDTLLERTVAVKVVHRDHDEGARKRFRNEARILASLDPHPALVQVFRLIQGQDRDFLVMEYVEGTTLQEKLTTGPLELEEGLRYAYQIAEGLAVVHSLGIIHRDVKAGNVIVTSTGQAKLVDFGIAKRSAPGLAELSSTEGIAGTLYAMSPEQVRGLDLDSRSDLFSLGVLIYEMLGGKHPFRADSETKTIANILERNVFPLSEQVAEISPELSDLVDELLEKDRSRRPSSAVTVVNRLNRLRKIQPSLDLAPRGAANRTIMSRSSEERGSVRALVERCRRSLERYLDQRSASLDKEAKISHLREDLARLIERYSI